MKKKTSFLAAPFLFLFAAFAFTSFAQETPPRLFSEVPQAAEKLNSNDAAQRASILSELIKPIERSCTFQVYLVYKLEREDYVYVVRQILEKNLTALDEKTKPEVWGHLAYLIGTYKMREFAAPIAEYLSEPASVQAQIVTILQNLDAKEFDAKIAPLLASSNQYVSWLSLETLIGFRSKKAVPALTAMLSDTNESKPYWAMLKLVEIGALEAAPQIAAVLESGNTNTRYWAIDSLANLNAKAQAKDLWRHLKSETDERLRGFTIAALIHLGQKEAIPLFVDQLKANAQGDENHSIAEFIYKLKPKSLIPVLISLHDTKEKFFTDAAQEKKFRERILRFLIDFKAREAIPIYRQNLAVKRPSGAFWKPNVEIARLLQELNVTEAVDDLIVIFNDSIKPDAGEWAHYFAGELAIILAKFGDKKAWKLLIDYAEKTDYYQRDLIIAELNKYANKKLWKEMQAKTPPVIPFDSVQLIAEISSRETGIPISFEYASKKNAVRCKPVEVDDKEMMPCEYINGQTSLAGVVSAIVNKLNYDKRGQYTFILDGGTVRILSMEKAVEWSRKNILDK